MAGHEARDIAGLREQILANLKVIYPLVHRTHDATPEYSVIIIGPIGDFIRINGSPGGYSGLVLVGGDQVFIRTSTHCTTIEALEAVFETTTEVLRRLWESKKIKESETTMFNCIAGLVLAPEQGPNRAIEDAYKLLSHAQKVDLANLARLEQDLVNQLVKIGKAAHERVVLDWAKERCEELRSEINSCKERLGLELDGPAELSVVL